MEPTDNQLAFLNSIDQISRSVATTAAHLLSGCPDSRIKKLAAQGGMQIQEGAKDNMVELAVLVATKMHLISAQAVAMATHQQEEVAQQAQEAAQAAQQVVADQQAQNDLAEHQERARAAKEEAQADTPVEDESAPATS